MSATGTVRWMDRTLRVGKALRDDLVDVRMLTRDRRWSFAYGPVLLGYFDAKTPERGLVRSKSKQRVNLSAMS